MLTMHRFDYTFLEREKYSADLIGLMDGIFTGRAMTTGKIFESTTARYNSVKYSNAIEGILTTEKRLRGILNFNQMPDTHPEKEIAGYRDALEMVNTKYAELSFCEKDILTLYKVLMQYIDCDDGYKKEDNVLIGCTSTGERFIQFEPVSAEDTAYAMRQLELAYLDAKNNSKIHPLILVPCVILDFLCIHPFADGNGRMSRLLTLLLLNKTDYSIGRYVSLEQKIDERRGEYYQVLRQSSYGWHDNTNDYMPFLTYSMQMLNLCYRDLRAKLPQEGKMTIEKNQPLKFAEKVKKFFR